MIGKALDIKKNQIKAIEIFEYESDEQPVFYDHAGDPVYIGQHVKFYLDRSAYPNTGIVQNRSEPKIACFDMLAYRWNYYTIKMEKENKTPWQA